MTNVKEFSADILAIDYRRSLFDVIIHLLAGVPMLVFALCLFVWRSDLTAVEGREAFVVPFFIVMEIGLLTGAFLFLAQVFDRISYDFDKTTDVFQIKGRKNLYKKLKVEGQVSEIVGVSCEIYGWDEGKSSEIFLNYRCFGSTPEVVKCGTKDAVEDAHIAECIEMFIKPQIKK